MLEIIPPLDTTELSPEVTDADRERLIDDEILTPLISPEQAATLGDIATERVYRMMADDELSFIELRGEGSYRVILRDFMKIYSKMKDDESESR